MMDIELDRFSFEDQIKIINKLFESKTKEIAVQKKRHFIEINLFIDFVLFISFRKEN